MLVDEEVPSFKWHSEVSGFALDINKVYSSRLLKEARALHGACILSVLWRMDVDQHGYGCGLIEHTLLATGRVCPANAWESLLPSTCFECGD